MLYNERQKFGYHGMVHQITLSDYEKLTTLCEEREKLSTRLTEAERAVFEEDLYNDAIRMGESNETNVINYEFFKRIDAILQKHRGQ